LPTYEVGDRCGGLAASKPTARLFSESHQLCDLVSI